MGVISTIGIDLAKHVFQLHGSAADRTVLFRRRLRREKLLELLASQAAFVVVNGGEKVGRGANSVRVSASSSPT